MVTQTAPLPDYAVRPSVEASLLSEVTNTLARWLPSDGDASLLSAWDRDAWLAAEWVVYWQNSLPWLVERLRASDASLPPDVSDRLWTLDRASRERTSRMLDATAELLGALRDDGVAGVPLKGAALAPLYYADPLLRPLGDIDLLVRERDLASGIAVLERLGYRFFSRSAEDVVYLRGERRQNVWAPDNVHPVEMHFTVGEEYAGLAYDLAELIWHSSSVQPYWNGMETRLPRTATLLHHVCAHATSDWLIQRGRLMHIDDIRRLSAHMSSDEWTALQQQVDRHGARFVYPALAFAQKYAGPLGVPSVVWEHLETRTPPPLRRWVETTELAETSESNPAARDGLGLHLGELLAASPGELWSMRLRSFFPRRWNLAKRYPRLSASPFWPLCYVGINADRLHKVARNRLRRR